MIKRLCAKIVRLGEQWQKQYAGAEVRASTNMERMFGDCAPALVAFKIENGYVVRSIQTGPYTDVIAGGFTYCKDHQAIADHIVSEAAREKVMPKQQSLSYGSPHANQATVSNKLTVR